MLPSYLWEITGTRRLIIFCGIVVIECVSSTLALSLPIINNEFVRFLLRQKKGSESRSSARRTLRAVPFGKEHSIGRRACAAWCADEWTAFQIKEGGHWVKDIKNWIWSTQSADLSMLSLRYHNPYYREWCHTFRTPWFCSIIASCELLACYKRTPVWVHFLYRHGFAFISPKTCFKLSHLFRVYFKCVYNALSTLLFCK